MTPIVMTVRVQVVREEQGDRVVDTPPLYPVPLEKFGKFNVTKPYFIAIARSEPILGIEGPEYWWVLAFALFTFLFDVWIRVCMQGCGRITGNVTAARAAAVSDGLEHAAGCSDGPVETRIEYVISGCCRVLNSQLLATRSPFLVSPLRLFVFPGNGNIWALSHE